jgi:glycosyltransferase involved in cell wall biosynthesis
MRVAWFTPLSVKSAIGRAGASIARELAKLADVEVWHASSGPLHEVDARVTYFRDGSDPVLARLAQFDLILYNYGNHLPFHREIHQVAAQYPGVVVLHDFVMHHFFAALYMEELREPGLYRDEMRRLYGAAGAEAAERSLRGKPVWETDEVTRFPLFERVIRGAQGVIAHSDFLLEKVRAAASAPAVKIPLPYEIPAAPTGGTRAALGVPEDRVLLLTVGHGNANKRLEATIEAIGSTPALAAKYHFVVAGPCDPNYRKRLDAAVEKHRLQGRVDFLGYVSQEQLETCLTQADVCVNLRYPAIEGASASAIEEMLYGKPVIVSDTGFYAELPGDAVRKVDPRREQEGLRAALTELLDAGARTAMGTRAREYAAATFRADSYAKEVVRFAWEVRHARPVFDLAGRLSAELRRMRVTPGMKLPAKVAAETAKLFFAPRAER